MLVQKYLKKIKKIFKKVKPTNDLMYQDIYSCICQKKKRFIIIIINWIMDIHNLQLSVSNVDAWKAKKGLLWIHD